MAPLDVKRIDDLGNLGPEDNCAEIDPDLLLVEHDSVYAFHTLPDLGVRVPDLQRTCTLSFHRQPRDTAEIRDRAFVAGG